MSSEKGARVKMIVGLRQDISDAAEWQLRDQLTASHSARFPVSDEIIG
jgi:hypothetical protein